MKKKKKKRVRIVVSPQRYRDLLSTIAKLNNFSSAKDDVEATIQRKKSSPSLFQQNFREEIYSKILQVSLSLCQNLKPHNLFPQIFSRKAPKSFNSLQTSQQTAIAKELLFLFFLEQPDTKLGTISYFRKGEYSRFSNKLESLDVKLRSSSSSSPPLLFHGVVAGSRCCTTNGC
jgi:hypothetical protein